MVSWNAYDCFNCESAANTDIKTLTKTLLEVSKR